MVCISESIWSVSIGALTLTLSLNASLRVCSYVRFTNAKARFLPSANKFAKVMFSQASVILSTWGVHGRCGRGGIHGKGGMYWGWVACMARGACVGVGMHGRGHARKRDGHCSGR